MFQPVSLFIGLRYSRSKSHSGFISFITFFSIAGILLGVAALITVVSVMNGFEGELKKRILGIVPHVVISDRNQQVLTDWPALQQKALTLKHVEQVTPIVSAEAMVQSASGLRGVLLQGIYPAFEQNNVVANHITNGNFSSLTNQHYQVVIGQSLAYKLNVTIGEKLRLVLPNVTRFTPMGRIPMQRTFTVAAIFNMGSQVDDSVLYIHARDAAKLLKHPADSVTELRFYLDDAFHANTVLKQLDYLPKQLEAIGWQQSQGALFSAVSMEKNMMWLMLSLIIAVAAFNIVSALVMVVVDKQGEIGILQTLGLSRVDIVKVFIVQGMFNGILGTALGAVLGLLLTFSLNGLLTLFGVHLFGGYSAQQLPIDFQWHNLATIILGALMMTLMASLYPAYRASKTLPAEVLRNE